MNNKRLVVVLALAVVLSVLIAGVASADEPWNKWQPFTHDQLPNGTFKFSAVTWIVKDYDIGHRDLVGYLDMPFEEFYYETWPECQAQGAVSITSFSKVWIGEITGRDMDSVEQETVWMCIYPQGWHEAQ